MNTVHFAGDGITLTADVYGDPSASPVVLLHGGGQTRHAWGKAAEVLAASGRYAVSVDQRGHGDSDWALEGDYSIAGFAGDARAVAWSLGHLPVLVGASLGGLASLVAIGESERPVATALILVDVTPKVDPEGSARIRGFMREGIDGFDRLEDAADAIAAYIPNRTRPKDLSGLRKNLRQRADGRWYWHWDPQFIQRRDGIDGQEGLVPHERMVAAASQVRVPTLLVRGQQSDIVTDEGVEELRRLVPHAEVVDILGAGHMVAGDRNDVFNNAVVEFIERHVPL